MPDSPTANLVERLQNVKPAGEGTWTACCPAHDDHTASLSISTGDDGRALLHCFANCATHDVLGAIGLTTADLFVKSNDNSNPRQSRSKIAATYSYVDADGREIYQTVRFTPKRFLQRRSDGNGGWIWNLKGVDRIPYRLPRVLATPMSEMVFVVEGEKDCDRAWRDLKIVATTAPMGAGKFHKVDTAPLHGRRIVVIVDADDAGRKHGQQIAEQLHGDVNELKVIELPGVGPKGDLSDWMDNGGTVEQLRKLVEVAPVWELDSETEPNVTAGPILDHRDPMGMARRLVSDRYSHDGFQTVHHFQGIYHIWDGTRYVSVSEDAIRAALYSFLDRAYKYTKDRELEEFKPTRYRVLEVLSALSAISHLSDKGADAVSPPTWLKCPSALDDTDPVDVLACRNGLLHLPTRYLHPHTPLFFSTNALDVDYDPDVGDPQSWIAFLKSVWPDDPHSIWSLQEWCGYLLAPDTRQQKALMIIGPKRSGKGTIARVIEHLVGQVNVASPTLTSLAGLFGASQFVGKTLAIISDARLSGRTDQAGIVELLLKITGEDLVTVNRKHLNAIEVHLPTRIIVLTNELPRLADASGALASRFIVLRLNESFYGREDHELTAKLLTELPKILRWAIYGWQNLREVGRLSQPDSGTDLIQEMNDLGSPVSAFIREYCTVGRGRRVNVNDLWQAWSDWCEAEGRDHKGTKTTFGRDLAAAEPSVRKRHNRSEGYRFYEGIELSSIRGH